MRDLKPCIVGLVLGMFIGTGVILLEGSASDKQALGFGLLLGGVFGGIGWVFR